MAGWRGGQTALSIRPTEAEGIIDHLVPSAQHGRESSQAYCDGTRAIVPAEPVSYAPAV
jgi:hypothetical protein